MPNKEKTPTWKKLRLCAYVTPLVAAAIIVIMLVISDNHAEKYRERTSEAIASGYTKVRNSSFVRDGSITIDGTEYEKFRPAGGIFARSNPSYLLIEKGWAYRDDSDGVQEASLEIYGKELKTLQDDMLVIEPHYICRVRFDDAISEVVGLFFALVVAALFEILFILFSITSYREYKRQMSSSPDAETPENTAM